MLSTTTRRVLLAAVVGGTAIVGVAAQETAPAPNGGCDHRPTLEGWCAECGAGWVGGVRVTSRYLFETLDAHGHAIDPATLTCTTCRAAYSEDGFCPTCRIGYVDHQAYFSRLTYELARGTRLDPATLDCPVCRANAKRFGWCDACARGMIGNVAVVSHEAYEAAAEAVRVLEIANAEAARCEHCAAAIVTDTECPIHRVRYEDGQPVLDDAQ